MLLYVRKAQLTKPSRQIPQVGKTMLRALWMMRRLAAQGSEGSTKGTVKMLKVLRKGLRYSGRGCSPICTVGPSFRGSSRALNSQALISRPTRLALSSGAPLPVSPLRFHRARRRMLGEVLAAVTHRALVIWQEAV